MGDSDALQAHALRLATSVNLTVVGAHFHTFADAGGVTGLVLLAESHLAIHTWPELNAVTLDVYVCNFRDDNSGKARALMAALIAVFAPATSHQHALQRGATAPNFDAAPTAPTVTEWIAPGVSHGFTSTGAPELTQSRFQSIQWHHTRALGRVFALDGALMASERDEFIYHECMVHVPALTLAEPKRALVLGGGDGCTARELLKHPSLTQIVLAELDAAVIESARREFAAVINGAFDDSRVNVCIGDALTYLRHSHEKFDLVVMDLTDPDDANAAGLYSTETYRLIREQLTHEGIVSLHLGSAFYHPDRFARTLRELRAVFTNVAAYKAFMPLYGAEWGMACASNGSDPRALTEAVIGARLRERNIVDLRFYTPRVHASLFAWPGYAEKLGA
jgi:spermidine synthase